MTIIAWVVADIYHAQSQDSTEAEITVPAIKSFSVNKELLESIKMRK